jgi:hypothetical protein
VSVLGLAGAVVVVAVAIAAAVFSWRYPRGREEVDR